VKGRGALMLRSLPIRLCIQICTDVYVCVYIYTCVCSYVCIHIQYIYICDVYIYIYEGGRGGPGALMFRSLHIRLCIQICTDVYVCVHIYIYVCVYICVYIQTIYIHM